MPSAQPTVGRCFRRAVFAPRAKTVKTTKSLGLGSHVAQVFEGLSETLNKRYLGDALP